MLRSERAYSRSRYLSGGFSEQDLYNAGARRVYADAAELYQSLDDLAVLP